MKLLFDNGIYPKPEPPYANLLQSNWMHIWFYFYERFNIPKEDRYVYEKMLPYLDTPQKVQGFMYSRLKYNNWDIFDTWLKPNVLFYKPDRGDCEDWSIFANACLKNKYHGYYVLMYRKVGDTQYGHCSYATLIQLDENAKQHWISLGTFGLQYHTGYPFNMWEHIVEDHRYYNKWTKIIVLDATYTEEAYGFDYVDRNELSEVYRVER